MDDTPTTRYGLPVGALASLHLEYNNGNVDLALNMLYEFLSNDTLNERGRVILERLRSRWLKADDSQWSASSENDYDVFDVLKTRAENALRLRESVKALECAWQMLQYAHAGTLQFSIALKTLISVCVATGHQPLAEHSARLLVSHYQLLIAAADQLETSVFSGRRGGQNPMTERQVNRMHRFAFPCGAAITAMRTSDDPCWKELLELALVEGWCVEAEVLQIRAALGEVSSNNDASPDNNEG